ncbi:hypothetical protein [Leptolinea tardivitalis]|uniref:Uncharacterized protein n=1 Tax=Leptolinea tardivitalis TaxID=229920 RepID=A0A0P6XF43_9CHLR|nr:hypothetical protein [Leptolinea tardivitalis]KPL73436.1 hypothetical protein ADM99_04365 [Leptolinea tardivitalis]GAP21594.1 hypothetical protein LTAR_01805 [Leptolinea tardivitalis]
MTISSIGNNPYLQQLSGTSSSSGVNGVSGTTPPPPPMGMFGLSGMDSMESSNPSEFFSKLQDLQESDPEKFQEVVSSIADKLEAASEDEDLSSASSMLSDLATKFRDVANGGDISQLKPPEPPANPGMMPPDEQYAQRENDSLNDVAFGSSAQNSVQQKLQELFTSIFNSLE